MVNSRDYRLDGHVCTARVVECIYVLNIPKLLSLHTATHQVMQNQNKLTVNCTGTLQKASSSDTSFAKFDL